MWLRTVSEVTRTLSDDSADRSQRGTGGPSGSRHERDDVGHEGSFGDPVNTVSLA